MNVVILSEVGKPIKRESRRWYQGVTFLLLLFPLLSFAEDKKISLEELGDCNWMVTYRGRTYDLAPLTREALSRPIESDIRYALQRVPASALHLESMSSHLRAARAHTILASIFVSAFVVTRIMRSNEKNENYKRDYDMPSAATGLFFLASTVLSWKSTRDAKSELVSAVGAFNEESPHKIEPASNGQALIE